MSFNNCSGIDIDIIQEENLMIFIKLFVKYYMQTIRFFSVITRTLSRNVNIFYEYLL